MQVPQQEESQLEGFLLWEQGPVGRWRVTQGEGERKQEETQAPLVLQGVERWRV